MFGEWTVNATQYARQVLRWADEIGQLEWVAPQDHMCEPFILAKTGRTVAQHQEATIRNFLALRNSLGLLVIPVVQGYTLPQYLRCVDQYARHGVDLSQERVVGVGSVCRRQNSQEIATVIQAVGQAVGAPLHGFGVKRQGLQRYHQHLASSDSLAWSYGACRKDPLPGCTHVHCNNCPKWALRWRAQTLAALAD